MEIGQNRIPHNELAFDIDGVVADTFRAFIEVAGSQYGVQLQYESITDYDFMSVMDIEEDVFNEIIERVLEDPLGMGIRPMNGAVEVLARLMERGPLILVTARPDNGAIQQWLQEMLGLDGNHNRIHLEATGTHTEKLPILFKHGIKYFIEDRLATCFLIREAGLTPIVYEQPWNQKPHPFQIVRDWDEIGALIEW